MSGHNKWTQIKRQKGSNDAKRSQIFAKLSKVITLSAKNGGDPDANPALKVAIDKAKVVNMPADNIQKAIKKGTGELAGGNLEEVLFEAYGPEGIALIIEAATDNNNRTSSEIKHILSKNGGRLGESGSVKWMFDRFGYVEILAAADMEALEMAAIEAGAEDVKISEGVAVIFTRPEELYAVKGALERAGLTVAETGFEWIAKNKVDVSRETAEKIEALFEALDEQDDVNEIYSNLGD